MFLLFAVAALASDPTDSIPDPLAPALAGKLECSSPDDQRKICKSIVYYRRLTDQDYSDTATILMSKDGPVVMETTSTVTVKGDAVCGFLTPEDLKAGKIWIGGKALDAAGAAPVLDSISAAASSMFGKELCVSYAKSADGLVEHGTIDGVAEPKADQLIEWVDPADGYIVAP